MDRKATKQTTQFALCSTTLFPRQRGGDVEHSSCRNQKKKAVTKIVKVVYYSTNVMFKKQHKKKGEKQYSTQRLRISQHPCRPNRDLISAMAF